MIQMLPIIIVGGLLLGGAGIAGWVHTTRLRIKNGYPLENMWGMPIHPKGDPEAGARIQLLTQENARLGAEVGAMKDRLAAVERIVTDRGFDVANQIEALRDQRRESETATGTPLGLVGKERA